MQRSTAEEPVFLTPLSALLKRRGIPAARIEAKLRERLAGRAPSRQQFMRWRRGRPDLQRKNMVRILWAVREVASDPDIRLEDLFDLDPASEEIWRD